MGDFVHLGSDRLLDGVLEFAPFILVGQDTDVFDEWHPVVFPYVDQEHEAFVIDLHPVLDSGDFYFLIVGEVHCVWMGLNLVNIDLKYSLKFVSKYSPPIYQKRYCIWIKSLIDNENHSPLTFFFL